MGEMGRGGGEGEVKVHSALDLSCLQSISAVISACREIRTSKKFGRVLEVRTDFPCAIQC